MSTRSGKRIHGSIHENVVDVREVKSERKTRGKRHENCKEIASEKKRKHYVRYPSEEDLAAASNVEKIPKSTRKSQKNTLKESNITATDSETSNDDRSARRTRRTKQNEAINGTENIDPSNELSTKAKDKSKSKSMALNEENTIEPVVHPIKKKSNKKKKRKSGSLIVEDIPQTNHDKNNLSNMSVDSFHSAAGSPIKEYNENYNIVLDMPSKSTRSHDTVRGNVIKNGQIQDVLSKPIKNAKKHEKKMEENNQGVQEMFLKADENIESDDEDSNQTQDMPLRATRSKKRSVKNLTLEDVEFKKSNIKDKKGKRKVTREKTDNNSLTKTINKEDVQNSSKIDMNLSIAQITDNNNITQDEIHADSFNNSPSFMKNSNSNSKKKRSKISSDKVENSSNIGIGIETVNIRTPDKLKELDTTKANNAKKTSNDKSNESGKILNTTFDKEVSNNSVNKIDQEQHVLTKGANNSLKKKRRSTYDIIKEPEANINVTFDKEVTNDSNNHSEYLQNDPSYEKINTEKATIVNSTFEKEITDDSDSQSDYLQDDTTNISHIKNCNKKKRKSTYDRSNLSEISLIATVAKEISKDQSEESQTILKSNLRNSDKNTIRKSISDTYMIDTSIINLDATFEKDVSNLTEATVKKMQEIKSNSSRRFSKYSLNQDAPSKSNLNATLDKSCITDSQPNSLNNSTFNKSAKSNTTLEMVTSAKHDVTFDKFQNNDVKRGSSLISSDTTNDVSSETSKDISRISITSDESMADNIINTTPVLIESSMDESRINISSYGATKNIEVDAESKNVTTFEGTGTENTSKSSPKSNETLTDIETSKTQLKREGTYTEIKYASPQKRERTFTKNMGPTTPKDKGTPRKTKGPNTPTREGTYTELKTVITPLKREGTYTELNPTASPSKDIASSIDNGSKTPLKLNKSLENKHATPPLKREGTFTKDTDVPESPKGHFHVNKTPTRRKSLPSPGRTPFPISKSASKDQEIYEKSILNVTRSTEKPRRSSMAEFLPRAKSKVMFCSPVDTPVVTGQMKGKIIKSNLKGSDKSFIFDESASGSARPPRKRSHTQSEAEGISSKKKRLAEGPQRLSRPRTSSASGKLQDPETPSKRASALNKSKTEATPSKTKPVLRTKLPNFAALHQKHFAKMESLDECQERKAKRARQLLTPTGPVNVLDRVSPKDKQPSPTEPQPKPESPKKTIIPPEYKGYTRFGFKLDLKDNPFSFPAKNEAKVNQVNKESRLRPLQRQSTSARLLPSRAGATNARATNARATNARATNARIDIAKQTILKEKSFTDKIDVTRNENRTVIKGVRTNRRFELQMQMRNLK